MYSLLFIGALSCLLSLLLTPIVGHISRRWGLLDAPDSLRKRHAAAVPRVGGVPILVACLGSFALLFLVKSGGSVVIRASLPSVIAFLPGMALIFVTGLVDDIWGLKPWQKLMGQAAAAGAACWAGVSVHYIAGQPVPEWLSIPLTMVWLVVCTNAMNLIDGVDGLAAGVGLFASATTLTAALLQDNYALAVATVPLVGALLGFLRYNFNPATIFLGDSGSLLVGFLLGSYGIVWSQKSATLLGMAAPMMAMSIPLIDTGLSIIRRFLSGKPIFGADRGHIHHQLLDRGLTARKTVLLLYGLCGLAALLSLAMFSPQAELMVLILFCGAVWACVQRLGYVELGVAGRMFVQGAFRRHLSGQISLHRLEESLACAATPEQCWEIVSRTAREFGFCGARMVLGGQAFQFGEVLEGVATWEANLPLSGDDFVELMRPAERTEGVEIVAPYVEMLSRTLRAKVPLFAMHAEQSSGQSQWKVDRRRYHGYYNPGYRRGIYAPKDATGD